MKGCWEWDPAERLEFSEIRQKLAAQLEEVTEAYSYLTLNAERDYYNVNEYGENAEAAKAKRGMSTTSESLQTKEQKVAQLDLHKPHSPLRDVDSGLDNDSEHSCSPPAGRKRTAESFTSDQLLVTPIEERRASHVNFQFDKQHPLPDVQEVRGGIVNSGFQFSIDDGNDTIRV